jgi:hypothetical protein
MRMMNLLGHEVESLLNCGIEQKGGHHHMSETTRMHINEECWQDCKYPIFHKEFENV